LSYKQLYGQYNMADWSSEASVQFEAFCQPSDESNKYFISLKDISETKARIEEAADQNEARRRVVTVATLKDYAVFEITLNDDFIEEVVSQSTSSVRLGPDETGWQA
jgi:hypothetical protein